MHLFKKRVLKVSFFSVSYAENTINLLLYLQAAELIFF